MRFLPTKAVLLISLALLTVGCASKKPAFHAPSAQIEQTHFIGSAISGPQSGALPADPGANAMLVSAQLVALRTVPANDLTPPGADARLLVAMRDRQPILSTGDLTAQTRWATSSPADAFAHQIESTPKESAAELSTISVAIPKDVTATLTISEKKTPTESPQIQLYLRNLPGADPSIEISLGMIDLVESKSEPKADTKSAEKAPPVRAWQRELMVLRPIKLADRATIALLVPFHFTTSDARFIAIILRPNANPQAQDARFTNALTRCSTDVARESKAAEERTQQFLNAKLGETTWPGFEAALKSAADPMSRRQAMVFLASQTGAKLSSDVYLVANSALLEALLKDVATRVETIPPADRTTATLSWLLDLTTLQRLAKMLSDSQLPPEISAVLTTYAGEAGRHAGSIEEIAKTVTGRGELQTRLIAENMIFLEDSSPAARVRAYDWLHIHQRSPAGFDPLAPARQRRDALEKALAPAPATTVPTTAPATP